MIIKELQTDSRGKFELYKREDLIKYPKISVVMSVYNGEEHVRDAIESILNQTYGNFEFIIINDGSKDGTFDILMEFLEQDNRIVIINQENIGLTKSLNRGIEQARGEYIARQDADDVSCRDRLETQYYFIKALKCDFIVSAAYTNRNYSIIKIPRDSYIKNPTFKLLKFGNFFIHGTLFIKSDVIKTELYDESFKYAQDYELFLRLLAQQYSFYFYSKALYFFKQSYVSISKTNNEEQTHYAAIAVKKHCGHSILFLDNKPLIFKLLLYLYKIIVNFFLKIRRKANYGR